MRKSTFVVGAFALILVACAHESLPGSANPIVDDGSIARASIVASESCPRAMLIELPEHCAWPEGARRTMILERRADIVARVDASGNPIGVRLLGNAGDAELDAAVAECAMHGRYRPAWDGSTSETCPARIRLARYPSDVDAAMASTP